MEEVHLVSTLAQDIIASPELVSDIVADSDEIRWGNALHTYVAMLKTERMWMALKIKYNLTLLCEMQKNHFAKGSR